VPFQKDLLRCDFSIARGLSEKVCVFGPVFVRRHGSDTRKLIRSEIYAKGRERERKRSVSAGMSRLVSLLGYI
jgi:hypothetical protein